MPKKMEKALKKSARKKGLKGDAAKAYVYGTMNEKGMMPKAKRKKKQKMDYTME